MVEPWSKFFWSDYEADEGLRVCSLAAQGLWMRMLCLMARATPKGELRIAAEPCTVRDLSKLAGESEETVGALLDELRRRGVFSTTRAGVIFSRRIRKDAEISRKRAESGAKGGRASLGKKNTNQGLLEQNASKDESKTQAPEARSQKLERKVPPNPHDGDEPIGGGKEYAFEGETIRLTQKHYDQWAKVYHAIPDLIAELASLDLWLRKAKQETRANWFHSVSSMLNRKHQELVASGGPPQRGGKQLQAEHTNHLDYLIERDRQREEWERQQASQNAGGIV